MVIFMSLNLPLTKASTLQVQELTSLILKEENKFQSERGAQLLIAFKVKALSLSLVGGIQIVDHRGN